MKVGDVVLDSLCVVQLYTIGLDEVNTILQVPMAVDELYQVVPKEVKEGMIEQMNEAFESSGNKVINEVGVGCRRWLSQAA